MNLTPKQIKEYVEAGGTHCPACWSPEIVGGEPQISDSSIYRDIECRTCAETWTEEFTLTGITEEIPMPNQKTARLRLTIEVTYDLGESGTVEDALWQLDGIPHLLANRGMLSGVERDLTVDTWSHTVEEVKDAPE